MLVVPGGLALELCAAMLAGLERDEPEPVRPPAPRSYAGTRLVRRGGGRPVGLLGGMVWAVSQLVSFEAAFVLSRHLRTPMGGGFAAFGDLAAAAAFRETAGGEVLGWHDLASATSAIERDEHEGLER